MTIGASLPPGRVVAVVVLAAVALLVFLLLLVQMYPHHRSLHPCRNHGYRSRHSRVTCGVAKQLGPPRLWDAPPPLPP
ncbi:UNVERIFIED_CONTAM: hypothetical protein Sradi_1536500 [Sesamum radiatum]|uniref:Uncharacterized protein n=1 Tax=Sesamum radiatum TaxID=300843 RepID=A0AAW2U8W1_SESRA